MINFLYALVGYFVTLNIITTFRVIGEDTISFWHKFSQICTIWIIPMLGVIFISLLLNIFPYERNNFTQKHKIITSILSVIFFIKFENNQTISGYNTDSNSYGCSADLGWSGRPTFEAMSDTGGDAGGAE